MEQYGVKNNTKLITKNDAYLEELALLGYTLIPNVMTATECEQAQEKLLDVYQRQEDSYKLKGGLSFINEENMSRCPLVYDDFFSRIFLKPELMSLVQSYIGEHYILHLQNGILNKPVGKHYQSAWHRDLPHQEWVISKPLAISALICISDFSNNNGSTVVLPHSHKQDIIPSPEYISKHQKQIIADKGTAIIFDSMLFHRAGENKSDHARYAINHVFTAPFLQQQIDLPVALNGRYKDDEVLAKILGYSFPNSTSVDNWREHRFNKLYVNG